MTDIEIYNNLWVISWVRGIIDIGILLIGGIILKYDNRIKGEKSIIISLGIIGMISIISTKNIVMLVLSLELLTYSTAILACIENKWESTRSSGLKYFLIGALSSGFILLGSTLIYGNTGNLEIGNYYGYYADNLDKAYLGLEASNILLAGLLFKIGAAPFHYWAPDVYDGVPTIITSWISIFPKLSIFVFIFYNLEATFSPSSHVFIQLSSILCLIIGSICGLTQYRIKRLLAYSSITHIGFLLLACFGHAHIMLFYVLQYAFTSTLIFIIIITYHFNIQTTSQLKGYIYNNQLLAICLVISLLSLAGLPPLIGFFGKLQILQILIANQFWFLLFICIITSIIACVQYLRIINILTFQSSRQSPFSAITQLYLDDYSNPLTNLNFFKFIHPGTINSHIISLFTFFILIAGWGFVIL